MNTHIIITTYFNPEGCVRLLQSIARFTDLAIIKQISILELSNNPKIVSLIESLLETIPADFRSKIKIESFTGDLTKAYVHGSQITDAEYLCFLHDDVVVTKDWLVSLLEPMKDESVVLSTPITNYDEFSGIGLPEGATVPFLAKMLGSVGADHGQRQQSGINARAINDFCILVRSSAIKTYGFLEESFKDGFYAFTDLHFRLITQGKRSIVATNAFVYHKGKDLTEAEKNQQKSNWNMLMKKYKDVYESLKDGEHSETIKDLELRIKNKNERSVDVLVIMNSNNPSGGGVKIAHNVVNALNESGTSAAIASTWYDSFNYRLDALYHAIFYKELYELYDLKPKMIMYSLDHNAYEVVRYIDHLQKKHGYTPRIIHMAQDVEGWFEHHDMKSFIQFADLGEVTMSVSPFVENVLKQYLPEKKITLIKNSISANFISQYYKLWVMGHELSEKIQNPKLTTQNPVTFIAMMREDQKRGAQVVDEALEILDKRMSDIGHETSEKTQTPNPKPQTRICFIGFGKSKFLKKKFSNIDYEEHFRIPEHKVAELLAESDVFIEPSYYQGFGLVAVEALCANCDVISSTNEGAMGVLPQTNRIQYFPVGNAEKLADAMFEYITKTDIQKRRAEELELKTMLEFMNRNVFSKYVDLVHEVLASPAPSEDLYSKRALQVLLGYYSFIETHYLFDPHLRLRYRVADNISKKLGSGLELVKNVRHKVKQALKK